MGESPAANHHRTRGRGNLRREDGSALVLVMFLVLMLTILGMAVLGATIGGAQRTETRENDVQSLHLAQKGLDEATAYIQAQLEDQGDIDPDQLENIVKSLGELNDSNRNITTDLGIISNNASGTIEKIEYSEDNKNVEGQSRQYYIDISTSALVNGVNRRLKQRITLDSYPDFLKYAFGSEGTLRLNGAPLLQGNVYAGEQLIVTQNAEYQYKSHALSKLSLYPKVVAEPGNSESGEVHVQSMDSILYGSQPVSNAELETVDPADTQTWKKILGISPSQVKIKEQKKFVQINVLESFWDKLVESSVMGAGTEDEFKKSIDDVDDNANAISGLAALLQDATKTGSVHMKRPDPYVLEVYQTDSTLEEKQAVDERNKDTVDKYNEELAKMENLENSVIYDGDLLIDKLDYKALTYTSDAKSSTTPKWFVVAGNLNIINNTDELLNVRGNILVAGNVKITGKVAFDSTMFVLGNTTIEDATIQGMNGKELVLISKGSVLVNRLDAFSNTPVTMKAFLYTDSTGELYGVGSMFSLNGGFFAKGNLTVNAVVGQVNGLSYPADNSNFDSQVDDNIDVISNQQSGQTGSNRRFQVAYNNAVYSDQQSSLPRVSNVSITVGPVKFDD